MSATTARVAVTLNIATTLRDAGVDVVTAVLEGLALRVDVRGSKSAKLAADMLGKAGLGAIRTLREGRGIWIVTGRVAA